MSDTSDAHDRTSLQAAFDEQAVRLGLGLELSDAVRLESRTVGVLLLAKREGEIEVPVKPAVLAASVGPNDDDEIRKVITGWESLHPEDVPAQYGVYTTDPFAGVGEFMAFVDRDRVQAFLASDRYKKEIEPSLYRPRRLKIYELHITYLGRHKAMATYRIEEEHPNDPPSTVVNSGAILVKPAGEWKLAVMTK